MTLTLEDFIRISDKTRSEDLNKINVMIKVERVVRPLQTLNAERFGILESDMSKLQDVFKLSPPAPPANTSTQSTRRFRTKARYTPSRR